MGFNLAFKGLKGQQSCWKLVSYRMVVRRVKLQRRLRLLRTGVFALFNFCAQLHKHDFFTATLHRISNTRKYPSKPYKPKVHSDVIT